MANKNKVIICDLSYSCYVHSKIKKYRYILGISFLYFFDEYLSSEPKCQVLDTTKIKTVLLDQFSSKSCVCECSQKV